ncbi:MAG TPA: response regulator transcription factor [Vicinamibacteria bacterium]|nr:response regulator transcription factor [Vicinamibacteria bacterium]
MAIQILLAEDEVIVREGVKVLLEHAGFRVIAEVSDGREAVAQAKTLHPDVAVLDLAMPNMNGLSAARGIGRASPTTRTILLTSRKEEQQVLEALLAGIKGYVLKSQATADLIQAIEEVVKGHTYLSPGISQVVVEAYAGKRQIPEDPLTLREKQVLQLIAEGKTTKEVAHLLGVSVKTAEFHRTRLMAKLDVHESASLVRYAIRRGLIQP